MKLIETLLSDVQIIRSNSFDDDRGGFIKLFNKDSTLFNNYKTEQINFVQNKKKGILRGLHYQIGEFSESKFFRVLKGSIQLAFADLRINSQTKDKSGTYILDTPDIAVLIPKGFATGYLTLKDNTEVLYCSDNIYHPLSEKGIRWNDPSFDFQWLDSNPELSQKDKTWKDYN